MTYFPQRRLAEYKINIQKSIAERKLGGKWRLNNMMLLKNQ